MFPKFILCCFALLAVVAGQQTTCLYDCGSVPEDQKAECCLNATRNSFYAIDHSTYAGPLDPIYIAEITINFCTVPYNIYNNTVLGIRDLNITSASCNTTSATVNFTIPVIHHTGYANEFGGGYITSTLENVVGTMVFAKQPNSNPLQIESVSTVISIGVLTVHSTNTIQEGLVFPLSQVCPKTSVEGSVADIMSAYMKNKTNIAFAHDNCPPLT